MNNAYFSKSLRLLAHPLSLAAIGLMLANDVFFKHLWPSWWTGKLSDLTGLFFLPFLAAALLSLWVPGRLVGGLAFGITGAGFALMKIEPGLGPILGSLGLQARVDPSDLMALLALLPAAWLWRTVKGVPNTPVLRLSWHLLALPLAAAVTLGDAAAPDMGVTCLQAGRDGIVASTSYYSQAYASTDGGLSWQPLPTEGIEACSPFQPEGMPVLKSADGKVQYRVNRGQSVDRSTDGGATWSTDYTSSATSEQDQVYLRLTRSGNLSFASGPYAGVIDPATGNLVLAMGQEGVLVRKPDGQYTWAAVGTYQHDSLKGAGASGVALLLQYQTWLAVLVGLGWLFTRTVRQMGKGKVWVILGWIGLGVTSFVAAPQVASDSYMGMATMIALFFMSAATLIALLVAFIRLKGTAFSLAGSALPQMLALAAACLLPYVLWGTGVLAQYTIAFLASTGLVIALLVVFSGRKSVKREA